jgi:hypothetical protein
MGPSRSLLSSSTNLVNPGFESSPQSSLPRGHHHLVQSKSHKFPRIRRKRQRLRPNPLAQVPRRNTRGSTRVFCAGALVDREN